MRNEIFDPLAPNRVNGQENLIVRHRRGGHVFHATERKSGHDGLIVFWIRIGNICQFFENPKDILSLAVGFWDQEFFARIDVKA